MVGDDDTGALVMASRGTAGGGGSQGRADGARALAAAAFGEVHRRVGKLLQPDYKGENFMVLAYHLEAFGELPPGALRSAGASWRRRTTAWTSRCTWRP